MAAEKPTIVLIPGAWLPIEGYADLLACLKQSGYPTATAELLSLDPKDPASSTIELDTEHIKKSVLSPLIEEEGRDVVILTHSYGAQPGSAAAVGLSKFERAKQGKKGGVTGFIALCGITVAEGASCADGNGGDLQPWVLKDTPSKGLTTPEDALSHCFNGVAEPLASLAASQMRPHALRPFFDPQPQNIWADPAFDGRVGYIMTRDDQGVCLGDQKLIVQFTGRPWSVVEIPGAHCSYVDRADVVADATVELIRGFKAYE